jgi:tetratricopeptide (TPR) repeat protein
MNQANRAVSHRRINPRAALVLGGTMVVVIPLLFVYKAYRERHDRALFLREARTQLERKQPQLALQYLNRYLSLNPGDVDALDMKGRILADTARNAYQALEAMPIHNKVLGLDPDNPKRQETRRRLVELTLRVGGRARAAEALARELIRRGASDAEAHRLLASALEGVGAEGDAKALAEASREYETAERIEPGDVRGSERLALLYRDKLGDPKKALEVLDHLVALAAQSPARRAAAHLARARYFSSGGQTKEADAEIAQALEADPKSLDVRLAAADAANQHGDTAAARRHLDAIPADARDDLRVKLAEGMVELSEHRPDQAIQSWRSGLLQTGGNSADLTWRLAQVLIDLGRVAEAEPLLDQYRRLVGGDEPNAFSRYLHGFALFKKDRPEQAIAELEAIRYKVPKSLEPHLDYVLGQCYERVNDSLKAIDAYRQATKAAPQWSPPWVAIANLQASERLGDAYRSLEQGLAANPNDPRLLVNSALILWRQQMQLPPKDRSWTELERVLERAARVAPNSVELALVQADYLTSIGKPADALARLEAAARVNPKSAPLWLARANLLSRQGKRTEALRVLDQAAAEAPRAGYAVLRASLLLDLGHAREARTTLLDGLNRVPADERPQLWKALGELAVRQSDPASARHAFGEWARLQGDSPEPRAALLELALAGGDDDAIRAAVDAFKSIGDPRAPYWRIARVEELLRTRSDADAGSKAKSSEDASKRSARFDEAERLIREIEANQPQLPSGFLLEGRLCEARGQVDRAIAAYEKALEKRGGRAAYAPLMALLVRQGRSADVERLRQALAVLPPDFERLATIQALKAGDKDRAEQLAARMVQGDPQGLDARVWQARVLNELGKPAEAEAALRRLIDQHPGEATPWIQLLMLQVSQKQRDQAAATVAEIRKQVKSDRPELLWAQCYRVVGDLRQAEACYGEALKRWPDDIAVRTAAIAFYEQTGRRGAAEESLRHVRKLDPALGWATRKLALLLAGRKGDVGAWDEALRLVGPTARDGDTPDDRLARARVYAASADLKHRRQAIAILEELASEVPSAPAVQELLARLQLGAGQRDQARAHAARAASGDGASPDAILLYASTLIDAKDLDEAQRQLDRLVALDPASLAVAELRARILAARGQGEEAAAGLERAFAARAEGPDALAVGEKMLVLLGQLKQPEAAARVAARAGTLGPRGACFLGAFLAGRGQLDQGAAQLENAARAGDPAAAGSTALALASAPDADGRWLPLADRFLDQALKTQPDSIDLLQKQARVRYLQGRFEEQIALFRAILDHQPSDFTFLNDMAWTLSEDLNRPEQGLERADEVLRRAGWQANFLDTRGVILTRLGKLDAAIKDLETAAAALPIGPVYYHLARAYEKKGRTDDFHKARELARQTGLRPELLQPSERSEWARIMEP